MVISNGMNPARIVIQTLSSVVFPMFLKKTKTVLGLENLPTAGGFIIAANHVDWLDGFYIAATVGRQLHRSVYFLTKTNNYWWTTMTIQIPTTNRGAIIAKAVDGLRAGRIICNFPEGERNFTKTLRPGKTGTVRMALLAGVPIIPLGISCDPGGTMAQSLQYLLSSQHPVSLRFGQPIILGQKQAADIRAEDVDRGTATVMSAIAALAGKTL